MTEGSELLRTFETELRNGVERIQFLLLEIEKQSSQQSMPGLHEMYRIVHTIKGASRVVGLSTIEEVAHAMEDRIQNELNGKRKPTHQETSVFLRASEAFVVAFEAFLSGQSFDQTPFLEELKSLQSESQAPATVAGAPAAPPAREARQEPAPQPVAAPPSQPAASTAVASSQPQPAAIREEHVNVPASRIDELFRRVEEAFLIQSRLSALIEDLDQNIHDASNGNVSVHWQKGRPNLLKETNRLHFVLMQFHELVRLFRMVPMRRARVPLQRAVRDLASSLGKHVTLSFIGEGHMVDASILEALQDPLNHIIRNAIDHGIESPEERQFLGKPREATINVTAAPIGGFLEINIADDGRGLDYEKIRAKAFDMKLVSPETTTLWSEEDWQELLFRPGFSTAAAVTTVSGRGIGLDIVRRRIQDIGGRLKISSAKNMGTTFQIQVPIGMLTPRVLLVRCGSHQAAVPTSEIEHVFSFKRSAAETLDGQTLVRWREIPIPVEPLAEHLRWESTTIQAGQILVVNVRGTQKGLLVDEIIGEVEQVAFPPPWNLRGIPYLGGVMVLGNGTLVPMIETRDLGAVSRVGSGPTYAPALLPEEAPLKQATLLVVDDSQTILALHRSILKNAGYEVLTAGDGAAAWKVLKEQSVQLVLTDIEMPHMNGLELIRKVRQDRSAKHLPIIVVSQYGTRNDLQRAAEAGADRYIVKSAFDPQKLLETVRELLE